MASGDQDLEPGRFASIAVPIMKAVGMGISARGGALGPMLVTGGDLIGQGYQVRREREVNKGLLQLMQEKQRSESTEGVPGVPSRPDLPPEHFASEAPMPSGTAMTLGRPAIEPTRREWTSFPTQGEMLRDLARSNIPEAGDVRGQVLRALMGINAPIDVERPQSVTEDLARARAREEESRVGELAGRALEPGATPQTRGVALAAGVRGVPLPPTGTRVQYTENGRKQTIDTGGNVISDEPMHGPDEQAVLDKAKRGEELNPYEQRVFDSIYKPPAATHARPLASEQAQLNWMAAQTPPLPDTPPNREVARRALADESTKRHEESAKRIAADQTRLQADVAKHAGAGATKELTTIEHVANYIDQAEAMADRMEKAIVVLAKYSGGSSTFNWFRQQLASRAGMGPSAKKIGDALAAVQATNAPYAAIAQGLEGVTGNRLAAQLAERMRAMHVHEDEPLSRNLERLRVLRATIRDVRAKNGQHAQQVIRHQQEAMEAVGKPGTPLSTYGDVAERAGGRTLPPDQDLGDDK